MVTRIRRRTLLRLVLTIPVVASTRAAPPPRHVHRTLIGVV